MKNLLRLAVVLLAPIFLMGLTLNIPTIGSYGGTKNVVQIPTIYVPIVQGELANGPVTGNWYSTIFGANPSNQDPSVEPVTINALTPSASINGYPYMILATRTIPMRRLHPARGNAVIQINVGNTPTWTFTSTVTNTPTKTYTPTITLTPTITQTPTITNTPTKTATPTNTGTNTNTPTVTNTPTPTITPTPTPTCNIFAVPPCSNQWTPTPTP